LRLVEAQPPGREVAIERQAGGPVSCGTPERVLVDAFLHGHQAGDSIGEAFAEGSAPQRNRRRHRMLHVRIPGELDVALSLCQVFDRGQEVFNATRKIERGVAQIQPQSRQHLVVTRPPQVQSAAGLTDVLCKPRFKRRMYVLVFERDLPFTFRKTLFERAETVADRVAIIVGNEFLGRQHFSVSY
jgi:hypothetical protein